MISTSKCERGGARYLQQPFLCGVLENIKKICVMSHSVCERWLAMSKRKV